MDRYFGIRRVDQPAGKALLVALSECLAETVADARGGGTRLPESDWQVMASGVAAFARFADPSAPPVAAGGAVRVNAPAAWTGDFDAPARWKSGHRLFFSFIQAILVGLCCLEHAVDSGDEGEVVEALAVLSAVLDASGAAMRFTGDLGPDAYRAEVLPSMMPPYVHEGFSGLDSRDHWAMVLALRGMRGVFGSSVLPEEQHRNFVLSLENAYAAHAHVCSRFGGGERASIRMDDRSAGKSDRSAVEILEGLARNRVSLAGGNAVVR